MTGSTDLKHNSKGAHDEKIAANGFNRRNDVPRTVSGR